MLSLRPFCIVSSRTPVVELEEGSLLIDRRPIVGRMFSVCSNLNKQQAAFSFVTDIPVLRAKIRVRIAPAEAIVSRVSSQSETFKIAVKFCS